MTKLIWKKTSKKFNGCYASWYAISPLNNFVFIAKDQGGQWSNHIIYKSLKFSFRTFESMTSTIN